MAVKHKAEKEKLTKQLADSNVSLEASRTTAEKEAKRVIAANNELENARAKGQVEKGNDIVEREFESGLKLVEQIKSLDKLNRLAALKGG